MNIHDLTLQRSFPTVMVPRNETVAEMDAPGERLLVAENGVFLEIRRPWLSLVRQIAGFTVRTAIPYGRVTPSTRLLCNTIPADLGGVFAGMAREVHPLETGAWIVWSPSTRAFRLAPVGIVTHTGGSLKYQPPALAGDEVLVMDCHSHGRHPAYFSSTDNDDDRHDVKMALVIGNCDRATPSIAVRLCAKGIFEETERAPASWYQAARVSEAV
ncbi:PRTRC system protein A (plasmid) [Paraburkholderia sprentiae WSM5005]|uniref:PRTRC system protein A n=1 Tax=Paraburkholderia sprentiae WSM5005 TaxID=754502 RepID=A0A1I9YW12_9BURK|nr:PRTRC system protein A [Paraburkholderia sprentiae]APA90404.1 PRTRC system protein A [Paraburkholderia sprentiae WSM5005]